MSGVYIPMVGGLFAVVDAEDAPALLVRRWYAHKARNTVYARSFDGHGSVYMHRLIASVQGEMVVDHRNGDGLNNRRSNLRVCTPKDNSRSRHGEARGVSGFIGVGYLPTVTKRGVSKPRSKPWYARVMVDRKYIRGGYFATPEEAARKRDELALAHHGEFAALNFPRDLA